MSASGPSGPLVYSIFVVFQQMVLIQKQQEYLVEQQKLEERQRMEKEILEKGRLSQIKNKNKDEESKIFNPLLAAF